MIEIKAPKGTKDIFHPEIAGWQFLEAEVRRHFGKYLYREIRTPVFEHSELFVRGIGRETEVVQKEMYTFRDKSDRELTLRPENTASVIRAAIENNLFETHVPPKFFYIGPMFRYDRPQKGRYRQFHQFGVEILGDDSPYADAEVISSAVDLLKNLGIGGIDLRLNSVGCLECRPAYLRILQESARGSGEKLCPDCRQRAETNPLRIFDCKNPECIDVSNGFPRILESLCPPCRDHFDRLKNILDRVPVPYRIDSRLVRGLDYYVRTAFEVTSQQLGAQNAILGGGRYDNLVRELGGPDMPGIGFAAGMERLILHLPQRAPEREKILFVACQEVSLLDRAFALAQSLRQNGYTAVMDYQGKNLKKQFKKADRVGAACTLILGEEESRSGSVSIKNMSTQEQVTIPEKELEPWLKKNL